MEKTKVWNKDNLKFGVGDRVVVFRRKKNGHPKVLKDGISYVVNSIIGDDLMLVVGNQTVKIHRSYLISVDHLRNEIINDLLK